MKASHRASFAVPAAGRDRYYVRCVAPWLGAVVRELLEAATPGAPVLPGTAVLDVGCGEQPLRSLIEALGGRYAGMDIAQNSRGCVDVVARIDEGLPEPWPRPEAHYPIVLCSDVLEHVENLPAAFENLRRLVPRGGRVVLTVPFAFPVHDDPGDFHRLTPGGLAAAAKRVGFSVERQEMLGDAWDVLCTFLADTSVLPVRRALWPRTKSGAVRVARAALLRVLDGRLARRHLAINANSFLANAAVLRAD